MSTSLVVILILIALALVYLAFLWLEDQWTDDKKKHSWDSFDDIFFDD